MTTRRAYALKLGGRFLVRMMLRSYWTRYRPVRESMEQVDQRRLAELEEEFMGQNLPDWMTADPRQLTEDQKAFIRDRFYRAVNMDVSRLRRWTYDPRVFDGVNHWRKGVEGRRVRDRLRLLARIKASGRPDGTNWSDLAYDVARDCMFVVDRVMHPRQIDYLTWVVLQNFGRDWARPSVSEPGRRLPLSVQREASLALARYEKTGTPDIASQL